MTITSPHPAAIRSVAPLAVATCAAAIAWTTYGAHDWGEIVFVAVLVAVAGAIVFGLVVPRALRKDSAGGTALALSIPALLLTLPAFWSGLPLVLGAAGAVVGHAGRNARTGSTKSSVGFALGLLAVVGYLAIYIADAVIGGNAGFLFD